MTRGLVITPEGPPRADRSAGGQHRLGLLVRAAARISPTTEVLHFVTPGDVTASSGISVPFGGAVIETCAEIRPPPPKTFWSYYGAGLLSARGHPSFRAFCGPEQARAVRESLDRKPDFVVVHRLSAMLAVLGAGTPDCPVLFDFDDVEHKAIWRALRAGSQRPGTVLSLAQLAAVLMAERRAVCLASAVSVCSRLDQIHLARLGLGAKVSVVPNALALPEEIPPGCPDPTVLFIGSFRHPPNIGAAERLVRTIWPMVLARSPNARLLVAGAPSSALPSSSCPPRNVEYLGFVPDLRALYSRSRIVVCPIMIGGGTRVKLIEAAAYGRPIIATRIGAEGLDFAEGTEILICDDDTTITENCVRLLTDTEECQRLGKAARAAACRLYDSREVERRVADIVLAMTRTA